MWLQVAVLSNVPEQQADDSVSEDDIGEELKASLTSNEAESAPAQVTFHVLRVEMEFHSSCKVYACFAYFLNVTIYVVVKPENA